MTRTTTRKRPHRLAGGGPTKPSVKSNSKRTTIRFANEKGQPLKHTHTFTQSPNELRENLYRLRNSLSALRDQRKDLENITTYNKLKNKYAENIATMRRGKRSRWELIQHLRNHSVSNSEKYDIIVQKLGKKANPIVLDQYNILTQVAEYAADQDESNRNQAAEIKDIRQKLYNLERTYTENIDRVNAETESEINSKIKCYTWNSKGKTKKIRNAGEMCKADLRNAFNQDKRIIQSMIKKGEHNVQKRKRLEQLEKEIQALPDLYLTKESMLALLEQKKPTLNQQTLEQLEKRIQALPDLNLMKNQMLALLNNQTLNQQIIEQLRNNIKELPVLNTTKNSMLMLLDKHTLEQLKKDIQAFKYSTMFRDNVLKMINNYTLTQQTRRQLDINIYMLDVYPTKERLLTFFESNKPKLNQQTLEQLEREIQALPDLYLTKESMLAFLEQNKQQPLNQLTREWKERYKFVENETKRLQKKTS
jgi:hypothetical protein